MTLELLYYTMLYHMPRHWSRKPSEAVVRRASGLYYNSDIAELAYLYVTLPYSMYTNGGTPGLHNKIPA